MVGARTKYINRQCENHEPLTDTLVLCADLKNKAGRAWRCLLDPALHGHVDEELKQIQNLPCLVGVRPVVLIPLLEVLREDNNNNVSTNY